MIHNLTYGQNAPNSATKYRRILTTSGWSNGIQEVTVDGVNEDSTVFVGPAPTSIAAAREYGVYCGSYYDDTLVFQCGEDTPVFSIQMNIFVVSGVEEASVPKTGIYGAYWDGGPSSTWLRTDDAALFSDPNPAVNNDDGWSPFDGLLPWAGMHRVEDSEAGTLVSIPKFWYKWTRDSEVEGDMKLQIADHEVDGFYVSPAHADRGDGNGERDVVYVGRYHCSTSDYKSTSGVLPKVNITRSTARSGISSLGTKVWQWDYAMLWTIRMLYLVEFADWNSQAKIGYGCGNNSSTENAGSTDFMPYHTGTMQSSRSTYGVGCQYRYIEDLWGNVLDWCDGIYLSGITVYGIENPANFSDSSGGTNIGTRATSSGCIKKWTNPSASGFEYALYPSKTVPDSNYATYICDRCGYYSSGVVLCVGGGYNQNQDYGLFCMYGYDTASGSHGYVGSRLMKLP